MTKPTAERRLRFLQRHPRVAELILLCVSLLLSLAVAETALRIAQIGRMPASHHQLFVEYHLVLGWQKKPNYSGIHVGPEDVYRVRETMNSRGLRGPGYSYEKPQHEYRIVVLGDSFAEGYSVEFDVLFSEVLKRDLNRDHVRPVEVINAGTGGYSTDQSLLWYAIEGSKYSPDLVILLLCSNDILFNTIGTYWRGYKPLFRLNNGALELTNVPLPLPPSPDQQGSAATQDESSTSIPFRIKRWAHRSSYLYRSVAGLVNKSENMTRFFVWAGISRPRSTSTEAPNTSLSDPDIEPPVPDHIRFLDWSNATDQEQNAGWVMTAALLSELKLKTEAGSARLLVMIVPGNDEVTSGVLSICSEASIDCIDPTARFRDEERKLKAISKQLTYEPIDGHWNAEGHRLTAEPLRDHISSNNYLYRELLLPTDPAFGASVLNDPIGSDKK